APQAAALRALVLGGVRLGPPGGPAWEQLLSTASVAAVAGSSCLSGLRRLELPGVPLDDEAASLLARSTGLTRLREVSVEAGPGLTERGRAALERRFGTGLTFDT